MSDSEIYDYPFFVRPLNSDEGGGYYIEFTDLPGCISDGDTVEEAIENGKDAVKYWIAAAKEANREIPGPSEKLSGKWVQRVPKTLDARLASRAKLESVSLNMLAATLLVEGLGERGEDRNPH